MTHTQINPVFKPILTYPRFGFIADGLIYVKTNFQDWYTGPDLFEFIDSILPNGLWVWIEKNHEDIFHCHRI